MKIKPLLPLLFLLFLLRILNGCTRFGAEDGKQIYLIGLKFFTLKTYPYWGPDVVYTKSQIPGGLQGLLVGGPFFLWQNPLSPIVLLNVLSLLTIFGFYRYLTARFPAIPSWFILIWLFTAPWMLHYTTHIENPSYVVPAAMLFFMAVFECFPFYKNKLLPTGLSFFLLGFCCSWTMQLHMSWVMFLPYLFLAFFFQVRRLKSGFQCLFFTLLGAAIPAVCLVPLWSLDPALRIGGVEQNIVFNSANLLQLPTIIGRFLSFASFELARFIGGSSIERIGFLKRNMWAAIPTIIAGILGLAQVAYFAFSFARRNNAPEWNKVRLFTGFSVLMTYFAFIFSVSRPYAHAFIFLLPVAMWYSLYCYESLLKYPWFRPLAALFLFCSLVFQLALGLDNNKKLGLYQHSKAIEKAFETRDHSFLGVRRTPDFEIKNAPKLWDMHAPGDSMIFELRCRFKNLMFKPQNLVHKPPFNQEEFCLKIDTTFSFGLDFSTSIGALKNKKKALIQWDNWTNMAHELSLVATIKNKDNLLYWKEYPIRLISDETWVHLEQRIEVPENLPDESQLQIYFWRKSMAGETVDYLDCVSLRFYPD